MKRWQEDRQVMRRQRAVMEMSQGNRNGRTEAPGLAERHKPLGKYRKKHALDCGHAGCGLCHREKRLHKNNGKQRVAVERQIDESYPVVDHVLGCDCMLCEPDGMYAWNMDSPFWEDDWCLYVDPEWRVYMRLAELAGVTPTAAEPSRH